MISFKYILEHQLKIKFFEWNLVCKKLSLPHPVFFCGCCLDHREASIWCITEIALLSIAYIHSYFLWRKYNRILYTTKDDGFCILLTTLSRKETANWLGYKSYILYKVCWDWKFINSFMNRRILSSIFLFLSLLA